VDWKLSIAGLFVGLLVGMTGMGGGSLMTPMLVFLFGLKPKRKTSMGVMSEPPPMPVIPTRIPIRRPASESLTSTEAE